MARSREQCRLSSWLAPWPARPWTMRGRTLTLWFPPPQTLLDAVLPPSWQVKDPGRLARIRFYDVAYVGAGSSVPSGRFREAVVALPVRVGSATGETSVFMWTDSYQYLTWGRELFGWPLRIARVGTEDLFDSSGGQGFVEAPEGRVHVEWQPSHDPPQVGSRGVTPWITPRLLHPSDPAKRPRIEVTAVIPEIVVRGTCQPVYAAARLNLGRAHPLHGLEFVATQSHIHEDFELQVGHHVEVLRSWDT